MAPLAEVKNELDFELLAEIAVGSTTSVELCRIQNGRLAGEVVAVKRLQHQIAEEPEIVDMFRDEVWLTAALKHRHVVGVVGWGRDHYGPFLAVELVQGVSLHRLMKTVFETGEKFNERMVVYLASCLCDGLTAAHALVSATGEPLNLVHRDLTPGNVLLGFDGDAKIADFGLAKARQRLTKTMTGVLKGKPQYMSPEQIRGDTLDGRSDIFSLGVVLFELFSGRRPWRASNDLDLMHAIVDEAAITLAEVAPDVDPALVDVVDKCLRRDPNERFASAAELRDRFQKWLVVHGYRDGNQPSMARFVRRNAMRQMRWFERAVAGDFAEAAQAHRPEPDAVDAPPPMRAPSATRTQVRDEPTSDERPRVGAVQMDEETRTKTSAFPADRGSNSSMTGSLPDPYRWQDEGPTLVKAAEADFAAALRERRQRSDYKIVDSETHDETSDESSELPTRRGRKNSSASEPPTALHQTGGHAAVRHSSGGGPNGGLLAERDPRGGLPDERRQRRTASATLELHEGAHLEAPGTLAPHDPNVPPVPQFTPTGGSPPVARGVGGTLELGKVEPARLALDDVARRLDQDARLAREEARRANAAAAAAVRAAALAVEACGAAARGNHDQAGRFIDEALAIDDALARGEVPDVYVPDTLGEAPYGNDGQTRLPPRRKTSTLEQMQGLIRTADPLTLLIGGVVVVFVIVILFGIIAV